MYKCIIQHNVKPTPVQPIPTACSANTPFWDGEKCVSCYLPKYWNHDNNDCESCPSGTNYDISIKECTTCEGGKFDFSTYKCIASAVQPHSSKPISVNPVPVGPTTVPVNVKPSGECPSNTPFWDGEKCVSCYLPKYWNHDNNDCESCPSGTNYDVSIKKCL